MNFIESFKSAIKSLTGNRARSFLTMLGIIIGITSVITMSAIGKGGQENITGKLKEGGYGKFTVFVDKGAKNFRWKYLFDDVLIKKIKDTGEFKDVTPYVRDRVYSKIGDNFSRVWFTASTPSVEDIDKVEMIAGRNFLSFEYKNAEKVAIIDDVTAINLYGSIDNALGKEYNIFKNRKSASIIYEIVGVYKNPFKEFANAMGGLRIPRFIRFPLSTYDRIYNLKNAGSYEEILIESKNPEEAKNSMVKSKEILENIIGIKDLYEVEALAQGSSSFDNILSTLNIFVTFVAGISLFVGGIGVMNIMLVSVIERTKEIGIRKAIGATNKDILLQFLIESVILTGLGGIIGIILGFSLGEIIGKIIGIPPLFTLSSIVISLLVSTFIGIIFGVIPAKKAAELNPIEALRAD
ncbi:MAG: ABC transporter permease [Fusobacterium sp. JB019]|nr:ABC transporter permease [Fusobacterium sp. JB020]MDP0506125.1 ABC transporter permease [Fusobacterium sp. JB019]